MELTKEQREWIDSAREMIDFLEQRPELIPQWGGLDAYPDVDGARDLAAKLYALGASKKLATDRYVGARRVFGKHEIKLMAPRENICERVQVGTEMQEVEVDDVPEGAEVVDVRERFVVRQEVPVYEVRCPESLLALGES